MGTRAGVVAALALGASLLPGLARAAPLDLANPTPRAILVEFEISSNPSTIGQVYSQPYAATYSATGNTGTVVISAPVYETAIQTNDLDYFNSALFGTLVPGTSTEFRLEIDLTTGFATAQTLSYQATVQVPSTQTGTLTRQLSTSATAGYAFLPSPPGFPFFCTPCTPVLGAAYAPATGKLNAVGSDRFLSADVDQRSFARAGDLRLTEIPTPSVPALAPGGALAAAAGIALAGALRLRRRTS